MAEMAPKEPLALTVETTSSTVDPIAASTMVDSVEANSDSPSPPVSTIPHSVQTSVDVSLLQGSRIFLDICSGAGIPPDSSDVTTGMPMFSSGYVD